MGLASFKKMIQGLKGVEDPLGMCVGFYVLHSRKNSLELKRLGHCALGLCEPPASGARVLDRECEVRTRGLAML